MKIKPNKYHFFQCNIVFLGHVLSADGISANPEKVEKVKNWPVPTSSKELQSFLGLASYYCHIILKFSAIAKCLYQLVGPVNNQKNKNKKNEPMGDQNRQILKQTGEHQEAFDLLNLLDQCTSAGLLRFQSTFKIQA